MQLTDLHPSVGHPITRAGVSLFPLYLHQPSVPRVATGPDAGVVISERPDAEVPTISVTGTGRLPTLLLEGEIVTGGQQDRTLNVSVLVAPGPAVEVPVSCVEAGRWGGEARFGRAATFAPGSVRRAKQSSTWQNLDGAGRRQADQTEVWAAVDDELRRLDTHDPRSAVTATDRALARVDAALAELTERGPLPGQCGVVVARDDGVLGAEMFGSPALLRPHWPALIRAALLEAGTGPRRRPSVEVALDHVRRAFAAEDRRTVGVSLGTEHHLRTRCSVGQALTWRRRLLHASSFALAA